VVEYFEEQVEGLLEICYLATIKKHKKKTYIDD
jgi:hypothetical protein